MKDALYHSKRFVLTQCDLKRSFIMITISIFVSCQNSSTQRVCEPSTQTGCSTKQHCSVNEQGTPLCLDIPIQPKFSGQQCESSQECEVASGCILDLGQTRCVSFCSTEDQTLGHEQCQSRFGPASQCTRSVLDREEIGVCTQPCILGEHLDEPECFSGDHCAVPLGFSYARCMESGVGELNQSCSVDQNCAYGLTCVPDGSIARCQELTLATQTCAVGQVARLLSWAQDPLTGRAYQSCWADVALQSISILGHYYRLDLNLHPANQSTENCRSLSHYSRTHPVELLEEQQSILRNDLLQEIKVLLAEAQINISGFWLDLNESNRTSCQRFDLTSEALEPTPCDLNLPTLCVYQTDSF